VSYRPGRVERTDRRPGSPGGLTLLPCSPKLGL
jgi:hypothetical protein